MPHMPSSAVVQSTLAQVLEEFEQTATTALAAVGPSVPVLRVPAFTQTSILETVASLSAAGGGTVQLDAGEYELTRSGSSSYCMDFPGSNVVLQGVPGRTIFKAAAGMPNASVSMIRVDSKTNVTIRDIIFDGNWGAEVGVTTSTAGINHTTQVDPKNHGVMIRGSQGVLIENCVFRQMYGDGVWMGTPANDDLSMWARDVRIIGCTFDLCARNGISLGAAQERVWVERCKMTNIWTTCIDSEPQSLAGRSRDVWITRNHLKGWWDPLGGGSSGLIISCVGGYTDGNNEISAARGWRINDNHIYGSTHINTAIDIVMRGNRIVTAFTASAVTARAPIFIDHGAIDITIDDNYIYDSAPLESFNSHIHNAAIHVQHYAAGNMSNQPSGVRVTRNRIHVRGGVHGIYINSVGGFVYGTTTTTAPIAGTATSVGDDTLTDTGKTWATNQWKGWTVICGGRAGLVVGNTATVLTIGKATLQTIGWHTPLGEQSTTPSAGAYRITSVSGIVDIVGNDIDCSFDGNANGGDGIYIFNDRGGSRIRCANNKIKNCGASTSGGNGQWGIYISGAATKPPILIELVDNKFWDDQPSATMSACIRFGNEDSLTSIGKLIMRGNTMCGGVTTVLSNVAAGAWLVNDGDTQEWAGYGAPSHTAPKGSTYVRKDPTDGTDTFYVNGSGSTTWSAR